MNELITKKQAITTLANVLTDSLEAQTTSKRFESMNKEKRVIAANYLPKSGTFTDFRLESKDSDFAHFRLITDKNDEISLSALSLICYQDDPQKATFKDYTGTNESLNGFGLLQNSKSLSKVVSKHLAKIRAKNELEVVLSYMNHTFKATPKKVYTYFPDEDATIETANSEILNSIEDKLTILNIKDAFELTELTDNKQTFDVLKSTYFLELEPEQQESIKEVLKEGEE